MRCLITQVKVDKSLLPDKTSLKAFGELHKERGSFQAWCNAAEPHFQAMTDGWSAKIDVKSVVAACLDEASGLEDAISDVWNRSLEGLANKINEVGPPQAVLRNQRLLADEAMRQTMTESAKALHGSGLLNKAADALAHLKNYDEQCRVLKNSQGGQRCRTPAATGGWQLL